MDRKKISRVIRDTKDNPEYYIGLSGSQQDYTLAIAIEKAFELEQARWLPIMTNKEMKDEDIKNWAKNDIMRHADVFLNNESDILRDLKALAIRCKQLESENQELKLAIEELRK